jgi:AraC-like DNA-binding protein
MAFIFGLCLGFIVSLTQIIYYGYKRGAPFWLALANLSSSFVFAELFLFKTGFILDMPHFLRLGYLFTLLYMPLSFFYVRAAVSGTSPSRRDLVHMLPVIIFLVDHLPFFVSSSHQKFLLLDGAKTLKTIANFSQGGLLTHEFYLFLITFTFFIYGLAELIVLLRYGKDNKNFFGVFNSPWIKWFFFYLLMQLFLIFPMLIIFLSGDSEYLVEVSGVFAVINAVFISCSLFLHPDHPTGTLVQTLAFPRQNSGSDSLYLPAAGKNSTPDIETHDLKQVKAHKSLSIDQMYTIRDEIDLLLGEQEPFLKHGYSLQELSNSLSRPLYQVSAIINQVYDSNFNELINKHRINYAIKMILEKQSQHLNIYGLADRCGFSNRNSFTAAFKKVTGHTPSDYFKDH